MERETFIQILMENGSTRSEAINHIERGAFIVEATDLERDNFIAECEGNYISKEDALEDWNNMDTVEYEGMNWKIGYVL